MLNFKKFLINEVFDNPYPFDFKSEDSKGNAYVAKAMTENGRLLQVVFYRSNPASGRWLVAFDVEGEIGKTRRWRSFQYYGYGD